jgi:hypothetical protein
VPCPDQPVTGIQVICRHSQSANISQSRANINMRCRGTWTRAVPGLSISPAQAAHLTSNGGTRLTMMSMQILVQPIVAELETPDGIRRKTVYRIEFMGKDACQKSLDRIMLKAKLMTMEGRMMSTLRGRHHCKTRGIPEVATVCERGWPANRIQKEPPAEERCEGHVI